MTSFTLIVIMGVLMILGGISLMATPLSTFLSTGYYIIILFFIWGIFGIARAVTEKRYNKDFFFSILSLILGIVGLAIPDAAAMEANNVLLYLAGGWLIIHGVLTIVNAIKARKEGADTLMLILGILFGVLEIITGIYSFFNPVALALSLGLLIGFYFVESGISAIVVAKATCKGGNSVTIFCAVIGVLTVIGGIAMLTTPLLNFLGVGYCLIMLFFVNGVFGIVKAVIEKCYEKEFFLAILSLVLGIIGLIIPDAAAMEANKILLYLAAGWFCLRGILTIIHAVNVRKLGGGTGHMILGIILGILELALGIYSFVDSSGLAIGLGLLIAFYFIESGIRTILLGSAYAKGVALARVVKKA